MNNINENNLYIRILKFGEKYQKGFIYKELQKELELENWEEDIIKIYLYNAVLNNRERNEGHHETMFIKINIDSQKGADWISPVKIIDPSQAEKISESLQNNYFIIKYDAYFNYIDYRELQEALKSSKEAKNLALWAIWIAVITGISQIIVGILQIYLTK